MNNLLKVHGLEEVGTPIQDITFMSSLADVNAGPVAGVGDGSAQDFVGQRRSVALPEKQEPKKIPDWISFRPSEVNVGHVTGLLFKKNQHSGDGVRDGGTSRAQN